MRQLLDSDTPVLLHGGYIYLPMLLDPHIEREAEGLAGRAPRSSDTQPYDRFSLSLNGRRFNRAVSFESVLTNFISFYPDVYERLRIATLKRINHALGIREASVDEKLRTILFNIIPHFIRRKRKLRRRKLTEEDMLDLIGKRIEVPESYMAEAERALDAQSLKSTLEDMQHEAGKSEPPRDSVMRGRDLREWVYRRVESIIIEHERERLEKSLRERNQLAELEKRHVATLFYVADLGKLEVDGVGFFRSGFADEYLIYVRTGEFALKDFYDHIYMFPECRVAVSTMGPLSPRVLDPYKHPLLPGFDSGQRICVRRFFIPKKEFSAVNVIEALEEGVSALFYGYNSKRRNGYNRLDAIRKHVGMIDFEDYLVTRADPKIVSGRVEVKNEYE